MDHRPDYYRAICKDQQDRSWFPVSLLSSSSKTPPDIYPI